MVLILLILLSGGAAGQDKVLRAQDELLRADAELSLTRDERDRVQTYLQTSGEREQQLAHELDSARTKLRNLIHEQEALEARIHLARERIIVLADNLSFLHAALYRARCRCGEIEMRCRDAKEEESEACRRDRAAAREALARLEEEERGVSALLAAEELERARCERSWELLEKRRPELEDRVADLGRAREAEAREREKAERDLSDLHVEVLEKEDQQAEAMTRLGDVRIVQDLRPLVEVSSLEIVDADGDGRFSPGEEAIVRLEILDSKGVSLTSRLEVVEGAATVVAAPEDLAPGGIIVGGRVRIRPDARPGSRIVVHLSLVDGKSCLFSRLLFAQVAPTP